MASAMDCPTCRILGPDVVQHLKESLGADRLVADFLMDELATAIVAIYPDATYSALKIAARRREFPRLYDDPEWVLDALRKAPRRPRREQDRIVCEEY